MDESWRKVLLFRGFAMTPPTCIPAPPPERQPSGHSGRIGLIIAVILMAILLITLAKDPAFRGHLQGDLIVFQNRACSFLDHHSWYALSGNEYQPGALWWMTLPGLVPLDAHNYDAYLTAFFVFSILLIGLYVVIAEKHGPSEAPWMMIALMVAAGPILLYRFELIVSLLVLASWILWKKEKAGKAGFLLGVATAIKLYPLILLPCFVIPGIRKRMLPRIIAGFLTGIAIPVLSFLGTGGSLQGMKEALMFHQEKPIGLDGLMGSILPLMQSAAHLPIRMTPANSIHGFATDLPLPVSLLNWIWFMPYAGMLIFLLRNRRLERAGTGGPFLLLMAFLIFQKNNNPQYAWWAFSLIPLIPHDWIGIRPKLILSAMACLALILSQIVFPLNYQEFLDMFYSGHPAGSPIFILNFLKNLLWLGILAFCLARIVTQEKKVKA